MAIIGVGVDLVEVERFERQLAAAPGLAQRLFAPDELVGAGAKVERLAGKFAAKEALIKALGGPAGLSWVEIQITKDATGRPGLTLAGASAATAAAAGVGALHLSIAHDGGFATAYVVAESQPGGA